MALPPPLPNSNMNFLPEDYVEKRQATRAAVVFITLLMVVVGGIVAAWIVTQWRDKAVFDENARVTALTEEASKKIEELQQLDKERAKMFAKAEITTTLMERVHRSAILEELTRLKPKGVNFKFLWLNTGEATVKAGSDIERIKLKEQGLPTETRIQPEVTIQMTGLAKTDGEVAQFIANLGKSSLLADVNLEYSEEFKVGPDDAHKEIYRKFEVKMRVNPTADLRGVNASSLSANR